MFTAVSASVFDIKKEFMNKVESADLILKLYDLRREKKLRKARKWMITFFPNSGEEIFQTINNPETSAYYRMVTT